MRARISIARRTITSEDLRGGRNSEDALRLAVSPRSKLSQPVTYNGLSDVLFCLHCRMVERHNNLIAQGFAFAR
jgi:hypothetical protein